MKGHLNELPLKDLRILPFNIPHAERAGELIRIALEKRSKPSESYSRVSVTNDAKMFAQADIETNIDTFVTADQEAIKLFNSIRSKTTLHFEIIDLKVPRHVTFGELGV